MTRDELVEAVREYALAHYDQDGWDVVVECYDDDEIAAEIGRARTVGGAIRKVALAVGTYDDYRRDIMATAF